MSPQKSTNVHPLRGLFATLEHGAPERAHDAERVFGTPTGTDLASLAGAHGIPHVLCESPERLAAQVASAPRGLRMVEVRVDRAQHRATGQRLRAAAAAVLPG